MNKREEYLQKLQESAAPLEFLRADSGLPGPRSNLELLYAWVEYAKIEDTISIIQEQHNRMEINNPEEYLLCCAVTSLGKHLLDGHPELRSLLRTYASDPRWRIRESAAMALQHIGKYSQTELFSLCEEWQTGNNYELRAIAAGLCEPAILRNKDIAAYTIKMLVNITNKVESYPHSKESAFQTLIQALCYCWSVGIVYQPDTGKHAFEELIQSKNQHIKKIVRENLKKNRLLKMDHGWVNDIKLSLG